MISVRMGKVCAGMGKLNSCGLLFLGLFFFSFLSHDDPSLAKLSKENKLHAAALTKAAQVVSKGTSTSLIVTPIL
jgi:hypothetical protein